jgi:serine phosphatase RsbU (regulator of sigma subunit)
MARNSFVTAIGATFVAATRTVIVARAGHLPLYAYRASSRTVEKLTPRGLGLALDENRKFVQQLREQRTRFAAGDVFLFVSDGVIEAHNEAGEEYGETRLQALLRRDARKTATEIRDAALADLDRFLDGREREDDCTVVVVRILSNKRIA